MGQFQSPHLLEERDAIRFDRHQILGCREWTELLAEIAAVEVVGIHREHHQGHQERQEPAQEPDQEHQQLTPFERSTVCALLAFARRGVAVAVVEVGLGGRLDATNVLGGFPHALLAVVTALGYDHQAVLGQRLQSIANHKMDILRPGGVMVVSTTATTIATTTGSMGSQIKQQQQTIDDLNHHHYDHHDDHHHRHDSDHPSEIIRRVALETAARNKGTCVFVDYQPVSSGRGSDDCDCDFDDGDGDAVDGGRECDYHCHYDSDSDSVLVHHDDGVLRVPVPLHGQHQCENVATAVTALLQVRTLCQQSLRKHGRGGDSVQDGGGQDDGGGDGDGGVDPVAYWDTMTRLAALSDRGVREGIRSTRWPGRLQWFQSTQRRMGGARQPTTWLLVDGAHNPQAARSLRSYLDRILMNGGGGGGGRRPCRPSQQQHHQRYPRRLVIIVGMAQHKVDFAKEFLDILLSGQEAMVDSLQVVGCHFPGPAGMPWVKSADPREWLMHVGGVTGTSGVHQQHDDVDNHNNSNNSHFPDLESCFRETIEHGATDWQECTEEPVKQQQQLDTLVLVCGSLYLVADFFRRSKLLCEEYADADADADVDAEQCR